MEEAECYIASDKYVQVLVIRKENSNMSEREAVGRAIELLREG